MSETEEYIAHVREFYPETARKAEPVVSMITEELSVVTELLVTDSQGGRVFLLVPRGTDENAWSNKAWDSQVCLSPEVLSVEIPCER